MSDIADLAPNPSNTWIRDAVEAIELEFTETFLLLKDLCQSPIEIKLLVQFLECQYRRSGPSSFLTWHVSNRAFDGDQGHRGYPHIWVFPQAILGPYRVDFLLHAAFNGREAMLVVECDGHDFHERTKEQAKRDKRRDRFLLSRGIPVARFTGAEIWNDTWCACAHEIYDLLGPQLNAPA